jgi:hypothetical protein
LRWDVILNPSEALRKGVKNLGAGEEDPSPKKAQDDLRWDVILNPLEALRRGVKNLGKVEEDPSTKKLQDDRPG